MIAFIKLNNSSGMKLPAPAYRQAGTGQGRSTELTALSMSNGLLGKVCVAYYIVRLYPAYPALADGARSGHLIPYFPIR